MRWLCIILFALVLFPSSRVLAADDSAANAAWAEITHSAKLPQRPLEWKQKPPTAEELAGFNKKVAAAAIDLADELKAFYKKYPNHPKAADAWIKEQDFRKMAAVSQNNSAAPKSTAAPKSPQTIAAHPAPDLKSSVNDAHERIRKAQAAGPEAALGEMERSGRKLATDFPNDPAGWELLFKAAQGFGGEKARQLYTELVAKAPSPQLKQSAAAQLSQAKSLAARRPPVAGKPKEGKPLNLAFTAVDGRQVDLSQMTGKVVLIDFWATWCGPCVGEMPHVRKAYKELHEHGFEIVGVSFDLDRKELTKFVAENDMPWPQYFDGGGWTNAINNQFQIRAIPTMYLVDKKGVLRDIDGRENLADKVRALLAAN